MSKRIIKLNSSAVRKSSCLRRLGYILSGYRERMEGNDITFGSCFHEFVAEYRRNGQELNGAIAKGWSIRASKSIYTKYRKEYLDDLNYFKQVCLLWAMNSSDWQTVQLGDRWATELSWMVPFYEGEHVQIVLCGTVDDICVHKYNPGVIAIRDYKTTSITKPNEYFDKYRLSMQLAYYYLGLTMTAELARTKQSNSTLAKLWLDAPSRHVFIEGIFLAPEVMKCQFQTSEAFTISEQRLTTVKTLLLDLCKQLDRAEGADNLPMTGLINASCESEGYGRKCQFFDTCAASSHEESSMILETQFVRDNEYNPLEP